MNIKTIALVILFGGGIYFWTKYQSAIEERDRLELNQKELINEMSGIKQQLSSFEFTKDELTKYLENNSEQLTGLSKKIADQGIKLNRVERVVSTTIKTVDTTQNKIILDSLGKLADAINKGYRIEIPFEDNTGCFEFKAKFVLEDGQSRVEVLSREYNDTINHVGYWERNQWKLLGFIPTRLFGKRVAKVVVFNNCGFSKTIVIEKKK